MKNTVLGLPKKCTDLIFDVLSKAMDCTAHKCCGIIPRMKREIFRIDVLETEIALTTKNLDDLGAKCKFSSTDQKDGFQEIDESKITHTAVPEDTSPAVFWKHYIGDALGTVCATLNSRKNMVDQEIVGIARKGTHMLIKQWINHPNNQNKLGLDSSYAFLSSAYSFDWVNDPVSFKRLVKAVNKIGNNYSLLENKILLDHKQT